MPLPGWCQKKHKVPKNRSVFFVTFHSVCFGTFPCFFWHLPLFCLAPCVFLAPCARWSICSAELTLGFLTTGDYKENCNCKSLFVILVDVWTKMERAGRRSGDRCFVWHLPLSFLAPSLFLLSTLCFFWHHVGCRYNTCAHGGSGT